VVAQPWRRAEKLVLSSGSCVAPLRLGGLRGKQSTPSDWLGGTGVVLRSASGSGTEQERHGARGHHSRQAKRQRYGRLFGRIESTRTDVDLTVIGMVKWH
jgi:hypothetical protein